MSTMTRHLQVLEENDGTLLKVAFATSDRKMVDQHFGSALSFVIYGVNPDDSRFLSVSEFGDLSQDGNEDKLKIKLQVLDDCIAVYCMACGASAMRQLLANGVQPIKVPEVTQIASLLTDLQNELRSGPSSWLAKALAKQNTVSPKHFDLMETEGWQE
ncbi:MAG TPA: NifB/NifX family molybdenum-iron cluster-binding protein [Pseudomonadales bacterium]|nr:NifB/NifX family molybdenum-iron cluster-binding protein [Pseudomonadales bacterium]